MAINNLHGVKVAILVTDGFEQVELTEPKRALDEAGAETQKCPVDVTLDEAKPEDCDAFLLPGGVIRHDARWIEPKAATFVRTVCEAGKPFASLCHGSWMIIDRSAVRQRRMTSWPTLRSERRNVGADWVDTESWSRAASLTISPRPTRR